MPTVRLPRPLLAHAGGRAEVVVAGHDVRSALADLVRQYPSLQDRIMEADGRVRRFVNVFVQDEDVRALEGLETALAPSDVVTIVPAVAGG